MPCLLRREFPASLSKAQRKFAHNQAQRMGMKSKSVGKEGVNRRLTCHQEKKGDEKPSSEVHIHPSSVNSRTTDFLPFLVYLEKIKTSRVFIRDCTPVSAYPIILFGGRLLLTPGSSVGAFLKPKLKPKSKPTTTATRIVQSTLSEALRYVVSRCACGLLSAVQGVGTLRS